MAYETAQQEKARTDRDKARKARKFKYEPNLFDRISGVNCEPGSVVVKQQPYGAPKNGTMGMTYIADADTGRFIGMVCLTSLEPVKKGGR